MTQAPDLTRRPRRPHGPNESNLFVIVAIVAALVVSWIVRDSHSPIPDPEHPGSFLRPEAIPIGELIGMPLFHAALYLFGAAIVLGFFGGWKWSFVEQVKMDIRAAATVVAALLLGLALVLMGH